MTPDAVVGLLPSCSTLPVVSPSIVGCHHSVPYGSFWACCFSPCGRSSVWRLGVITSGSDWLSVFLLRSHFLHLRYDLRVVLLGFLGSSSLPLDLAVSHGSQLLFLALQLMGL